MSGQLRPRRSSRARSRTGGRRSRTLRLASIAVVAAAAIALPGSPAGALAPQSGGDPAAAEVGQGTVYYPFSPAAGNQVANPHLAVVDSVVDGARVPQLFLAFAKNPDVGSADADSQLIVSPDGGQSFLDGRRDNLSTSAMTQLANGDVLTVQFIPRWADEARTTIDIVSGFSTDGGRTFHQRLGRFTPPAGKALAQSAFDRGLRVHKGLMQLADGTLITAAYGRYVGDANWSSLILQSTDEGLTWTQRGAISNGQPNQGTSEVGFARTTDGRLIAVLRGSPESRGLLQSYSSDDGRTWTVPTKLIAPTDTVNSAIEPSVVLQPNGILVLVFGRPDNNLLISADGKGDDWGSPQLVFENRPPDGYWTHGSSGNTTMVSLDSSRSLVAGDLCAAWGCQEQGEQYGVFARNIDAVTPHVGRLDLRQLVKEGLVTISGTFARAPRKVPQTRPSGAVDGSSSPMAAAALAAANGSTWLTLKLDKTYSVNRIGLMLAKGVPQDAVVQLSVDGTHWAAPVITAAHRVDYALRYADFAPQQARYVRVSAPAGGTLTAVNELEVYRSDAQTFDNDVVNAVPRGWVNATHASTVDYRTSAAGTPTAGLHSRRALRLLDQDSKALALAQRPFSARPAVTVDADLAGMTLPGGMLLSLKGTDASGAAVEPWRLHFNLPAKTINAYDGKAWHVLGTLTDPPAAGDWRHLQVSADTTGLTVTFGAQTFTVATPNAAATSLNALEVSSIGTAFTGSSYYLDNVAIG